jgi:hypothetical protein
MRTVTSDQEEIGVADVVDACDVLIDRLEQYLTQLKAEHPTARGSDDPRYLRRVERGIGWTEELLDTMGQLFGKLRGGLGISVCLVGALLAASTGIVGATVVTSSSDMIRGFVRVTRSESKVGCCALSSEVAGAGVRRETKSRTTSVVHNKVPTSTCAARRPGGRTAPPASNALRYKTHVGKRRYLQLR